MTTRLELSLPAIPGSVRVARDAVAETFAAVGAGQQATEDVRLCVSEAVTNAVLHAYRDGRGNVGVSVEDSDGELTVVVRDEGKGLTRFQQEGELGYGLRIIDRLATRCAISTAPDVGTEVRMAFALEPGPSAARGPEREPSRRRR
jgi:anti-sigma regulatory factor (Ser/Thr protein kinase)